MPDQGSRRRAVLVVCDSLRADHLSPELTPALWTLQRTATRAAEYRSLFPSTTRVVSASIATGCLPAHHGLVGNRIALDEGGGLASVSTGQPDFLDRWRKATGRTLLRPTLAERLAREGGVEVMSNVSPGAAYLHDPDGHGTVYHRAGSLGPARRPLPESEQLAIHLGTEGDAAMTARFCDEIVCGRRPALAVLWLSEPDHTGHRAPLGSAVHGAAIAAADRCVAKVLRALERDGASEGDCLLIACSDHGMESIGGIVRIDEELVRAGLKASTGSTDVVVAPNGTGALIYRRPDAPVEREDLRHFLASQEWVGRLLEGTELAGVGLPDDGILTFGISLAMNPYWPPSRGGGTAWESIDPAEPGDHLHCGQHGGLGPNEQRPFLLLRGPGFPANARMPGPVSPVDLAPTILRHLGADLDGMDGHPLQGRAVATDTFTQER